MSDRDAPNSEPKQGLSYADSGVNYHALDYFKRACQKEAAQTVDLLARHGLAEAEDTRGESAYLMETKGGYLAHVEEGLGTKNLVADAMADLTGQCYYKNIGVDTVATIVNDLITVGCLPASVAMHAAVGDSAWFEDKARAADLAAGFAEGCRQAGAVWGGGETPALADIVNPDTIVLAGSAVGQMPREHRITGKVQEGDAIVMLASRGVQTNGLSLCRKIAGQLPDGYLETCSDGRSFGESLLDPSVIYCDFIAACRNTNVPLNYAVHMTGHGWRKLMRLDKPFVYRVTDMPTPQPVFDFLEKRGPVERREMFATFNMGVGFAVMISQADVAQCLAAAETAGNEAWVAGVVESDGDRKAVEIVPEGITFEGGELQGR